MDATARHVWADWLWPQTTRWHRSVEAVIGVQGLNFIAGLMLLVVHDEEKVFWLMDTLLNKILPGTYNSSVSVHHKEAGQVNQRLLCLVAFLLSLVLFSALCSPVTQPPILNGHVHVG